MPETSSNSFTGHASAPPPVGASSSPGPDTYSVLTHPGGGRDQCCVGAFDLGRRVGTSGDTNVSLIDQPAQVNRDSVTPYGAIRGLACRQCRRECQPSHMNRRGPWSAW